MNITLFNRDYTVRRFGESHEVNGYITAAYTDLKVSMHVHPLGYNAVQALPEGERKVKRLEAHSAERLVTAEQGGGTKADLLYYQGDWYECVSEAEYDHTLLSHYNYQFVILAKDAAGTIDTEPPDIET
jgi:hypothetical protein